VGRVSWTRELAFDPTCVDVNVYSVAVSQFQKEGDTTFVSNIFVKAIESEPKGYSIVEVPHLHIYLTLSFDDLPDSSTARVCL
jgi:hypothetical protein